jgi:type IV pilus assembly protein PilC
LRRRDHLLLWKVVPIFATLFNGLGVDLPLPTRIVIALSNFVGSIYGLMILVVLRRRRLLRLEVLVRHAARALWRSTRMLLKLPVCRHRAAQDCRGALHAHPGHLDLQRRAHPGRPGHHRAHLGNAVVEKAISQTRKAVEAGRSLVDPLKETDVFPGMVTQMIGVGEQTGAMDAMLQKIADFYEDEVDAAVKDLLTAMEPIMIVFLGVVVGGVVISMYLPLFSLIGKLAGH